MSGELPLVVDASVAVKWIFDEPDSEAAHRLRERQMLAPELLLLECGSVIWRRVVSGELTPHAVPGLLAVLQSAPVRFALIERLLEDVVRLSLQLRHPVYDCAYLALAIANDLQLVTADRRFARATRSHSAFAGHVVTLADLAH